jgi:hypothetical protein
VKEKAQIFLFAVGLFIAGYVLVGWLNGLPALLGVAMMVLAVLMVIGTFTTPAAPPRQTYCLDCGQYLGMSNKFVWPCQRCGCNRYTFQDPGVGRTMKYR